MKNFRLAFIMLALSLVMVMPMMSGTVVNGQTTSGGTITWTTNAVNYRGRNGERFTFVCPGNGSFSNVWGTDVYTDDSSICTAAVHAGLITPSAGGTVTIEIRPGQQSYTGSTRNGVSSSSYGAWSSSYVFVGSTPAPQGNRPPNAPTLISPADTRGVWYPQVDPSYVNFQWRNNGHPDGHPLVFVIEVFQWDVASQTWQFFSFYRATSGTSMWIPLTSNTYYAWNVAAVDVTGGGSNLSDPS